MEGILKRCAYAQPAQSRPRGQRGTEMKPLKHCQTTKKAEPLPCLSHLAHHGCPPQTHCVLARATLLSGVSPAPTAQPWAYFPETGLATALEQALLSDLDLRLHTRWEAEAAGSPVVKGEDAGYISQNPCGGSAPASGPRLLWSVSLHHCS